MNTYSLYIYLRMLGYAVPLENTWIRHLLSWLHKTDELHTAEGKEFYIFCMFEWNVDQLKDIQ